MIKKEEKMENNDFKLIKKDELNCVSGGRCSLRATCYKDDKEIVFDVLHLSSEECKYDAYEIFCLTEGKKAFCSSADGNDAIVSYKASNNVAHDPNAYYTTFQQKC
jgi:hypothetical protein